MKRMVIVGLALLVLALPLMAAHAFVGPEKCKMCHKVEYTSWQATKHAKAWSSLKPAEQSDAKCNGCHSTNLPALTGVSCEACHGAGGDYWKMSVMKDQKLAIQNGLVLPTKEVCEKCHNKKSPTFKGFDYEKSKGLVHDVKKK